MAEQRSDETPHRYEETYEPHNPPNSVLSKDARRAAVVSYFVPLVILCAAIGVVLVYWTTRPNYSEDDRVDRSEVGTVGSTEGGFQPAPKPNDTQDELQFRAGNLTPITDVGDLDDLDARAMNGRRVSIAEAEVDSMSENTIWIREGDRRFAVIPPQGVGSLAAGTKISIAGHIQPDANGTPVIRAESVGRK
jgi:hypothetical protein